MSKSARSRPPRLEPSQSGPREQAAAPGPAQRLRAGRAAGTLRSTGPTELRRLVERIAAGDVRVLGGMDPFPGCTSLEVREALSAIWGVEPDCHEIDPERTIAAGAEASRRLAALAARGGRVVFATAAPASLLPVHQHLARLVAGAGADLADEPDSPPFRCDGRGGRMLRRAGGVAVVTDGSSILATADSAVSEELLFGERRPDLVVGDGPFVVGAVRSGLPAVAFSGVRGLAMGVAALRGAPVTVVPVDTGRPPSAYEPLLDVMQDAFVAAIGDAS